MPACQYVVLVILELQLLDATLEHLFSGAFRYEDNVVFLAPTVSSLNNFVKYVNNTVINAA